MLSFYKKYAKTLIDLSLLALTVFLFMITFTFSFKVATPIFIAVFIYLLVSPVLNFLRRKGLKLNSATPISFLLYFIIVLSAFLTLGSILASQIHNLSVILPKGIAFLKMYLIENGDFLQSKIKSVPPDIINKLSEMLDFFVSKGSQVASNFVTSFFVSIKSIFTNVANTIIGVVLAYFLCLEIDTWKNFINTKTPKFFKLSIDFLVQNVFKGIGKYIKAQLLLISFSFMIVFIGLLVAGVENAFSIAVLAAIFDILPLLGMPVIFIPWAIYSFIMGKTSFAVFLICLLAVTMVFRQIAEPKIAGDSLGVSAFTMLSIMIISLSIFGIAGIIASPLLTILLKSLHDKGYLSQWIYIPSDELTYNKQS